MCPDIDKCISKLLRGNANLLSGKKLREDGEIAFKDPGEFEYPEMLTAKEVYSILESVRMLLKDESTCIDVSSPITVAGDLHGQLFDLYELLSITGRPPFTNILFLGDYVDRGHFSVETICLVFLFKLKYPDKVFVLRGNHETKNITTVYGFYDEIQKKYADPNVWLQFTETFNYLPLAATIDNNVFCDHGGLSPSIDTVDVLKAQDRIRDLPHEDRLSDLLWSDPDVDDGWNPSNRGAGYCFGDDISEQFLHRNKLTWLCRAHQVSMDGYHFLHNYKVCTVFSAPNYCYRCNNKASVCEIYTRQSNQPQFVQFESAPERAQPTMQPCADMFE